jgi:protein TIF31
MQGDLMYITFTSLEGDMYYITGHIKGFFVSRSSNQKFDPLPKNPQKHPSHSLLTLLHSLSPNFTKAFTILHSTDQSTEILSDAALANALPAFPWLVQPPTVTPDSVRTQRPWLDALAEGQGNLRDWNDEIQSTRSLPSTGVRERLLRERLLQKSLADFSSCAVQAAILVRRGEILALDPIPEAHEHEKPVPADSTGTIWHYNNIFISLGGEDILGLFDVDGGPEASRVAVGKDVMGVARVNSLLLESHADSKDPLDELCTLGTVIVDYLGERLVAQSVVPGIFQQVPENKDADGASAGVHRIVYGGVDNGEKIFIDAEFEEKFKGLMDKLHVKRHDVWEVPKNLKHKNGVNGDRLDGVHADCPVERKKRTLVTSLETKGLRGADGRKYVLDLYKLSPVDITFIEEHCSEEEDSYPHRMVFLRGECVDAFWESKLRAWVSAKLEELKNAEKADGEKDDADTETEKIDISGFAFALNPDVFTVSQAPVTEEEKKQVEEDETDVRACCAFLRETLIPKLLNELGDGSGGWPIDSKGLTGTMHRHGVNMRYLGRVVELCGDIPKLKIAKV